MKVLGLAREEITRELRNGNITLCIVGLGYVGLPLATLLAIEGAVVIGCERRRDILGKILAGETPIQEHDIASLGRKGARMLQPTCPNCGVSLMEYERDVFCPACARRAIVSKGGVQLLTELSEAYASISSERTSFSESLRLAIEGGKLRVTADTIEAVRKSDVTLICVGTPIGKNLSPDYRDLTGACKEIGKGLKKGDLVILKSTVSPGTTEEVVLPILEKFSGLKAGSDFGLAHSPERIKEGYALFEFRTLPRIVAGVNAQSAIAAAAILEVFPSQVHLFDCPRITETAKLFENIYRDVNIALANELALTCEKLGVDVIRAIEAARTDPKTNLLLPGPGVGGYCLPKDSYYLASPAIKAGFRPRLSLLARKINNGMPLHVIELVKDSFRDMHRKMRAQHIGILGLAFKGNSGDLRNTPVEELIRNLSRTGAKIRVHDPHVDPGDAQNLLSGTSAEFSEQIWHCIQDASCLIIAADHLEYRRLNLVEISSRMSKPGALVDTRHIFKPQDVIDAGLIYRGVGRSLTSCNIQFPSG